MIKYFIRTTKERVLDESISRELGENYTLLIDTEHKPIDSFIKQLSDISEYDSVLLEDDVVLCKNFKMRIEKAISEYPDRLINFFTDWSLYFTTYTTLGIFRSNQCTYYPKGLSKIISDKMKELYSSKVGYDVIEHWALQTLAIPHVKYRPCLVQHKGLKSLITKDSNARVTPFFIDWLEKWDIDYNDSNEVVSKLDILSKERQDFIDKLL